MESDLGCTKDGLYFRNLGRKEGTRSQPKLYLGRNHDIAKTRNVLLEAVWEGAERFWNEHVPEGEPCWDEDSLAVADAVRKGEKIAYINPPASNDPELAAEYLDSFRRHMPIRVEFRGQWPATTGQPQQKPSRRSSQSLHAALKSYRQSILDNVRLQPETASSKIREVDFIIEHLPERDLREFDTEAIDNFIEVLRRRPSGKKVERISRKYASNVLKQFRAFVRWLNKSSAWFWNRPDDYEVTPVRIEKLPTDRKVSAMSVPIYNVEELAVLWQYAHPFDRLMICLGLNCAFGRREMATVLLKEEIFLKQKHPYASILHIDESDSDSWIMRERLKTSIYGEWKLWPITVQSIRWWTKHRPKCEATELIVSSKGHPFTTTRGGHGNQQLANKWNALSKRVIRDIPEFKKLSINKLRKTSTDLIQYVSRDGEVASVHSSHGKYTEDDLLSLYANRPFFKLHPALDGLFAHLQPVWNSVADPFPESESKPKGGANISRGTIRRIQKMVAQGYKRTHVAKTLEVSTTTVNRWAKRREDSR